MNLHGSLGWDLVPELQGYTLEWSGPGTVFFSKLNRLYKSTHPLGQREFVGMVPAPWWKSVASRLRLGQRLLRFMFTNVLPLAQNNIFVAFCKEVGILSAGRYQPLGNIIRPHRIMRGGCATSTHGKLYWGEYISNPTYEPVNIYRYSPEAGTTEVAYTFPAKRVRHVHGVFSDPYSQDLWCVTGDRDHECLIMRTSDEFATHHIVGEGDETWRTVSLLFTPEAIIYGSDAGGCQNYLYSIHRKTWKRSKLAEIPGPIYYSLASGSDLLFFQPATSRQNLEAVIWNLTPSGELVRLLTLSKDLIPYSFCINLFMHGVLNFPQGPGMDGAVYLHGIGLKGIDGKTLRLYRKLA